MWDLFLFFFVPQRDECVEDFLVFSEGRHGDLERFRYIISSETQDTTPRIYVPKITLIGRFHFDSVHDGGEKRAFPFCG